MAEQVDLGLVQLKGGVEQGEVLFAFGDAGVLLVFGVCGGAVAGGALSWMTRSSSCVLGALLLE